MCRGLSPTVAISSRTRSRFSVPACQAERLDRLRDDFADRHSRIERRVRILEDHLQVPALLAQLARRQVRQVRASEEHFAGRRLDQPQDRAAERGLAAAGLADQAQRLARRGCRASTPSTACTMRRTRLPPVIRSHSVPPPRSKWTFRSRIESSGEASWLMRPRAMA